MNSIVCSLAKFEVLKRPDTQGCAITLPHMVFLNGDWKTTNWLSVGLFLKPTEPHSF